MRSTILQDLSCHWYKKTIPFIPIPIMRSAELVDELKRIGADAVGVDRFLQDQHSHIQLMIDTAPLVSIRTLMLSGDDLAKGLNAEHLSEAPMRLAGLRIRDRSIVSDDILFKIAIPNEQLLVYLFYVLRRLFDNDQNCEITRDTILEVGIPNQSFSMIVEAITDASARDGKREFEAYLRQIDSIVGAAIGLTPEQVTYIQKEMEEDPILSRMRPMLRQRGLRVQAYAEVGDDDRYG
ncbi:MAG: hypothetical protein ABI810_08315 [Sphingomonas bacterium]